MPQCGEIYRYNGDICGYCKIELIETDIEVDLYDNLKEIKQQIYNKYRVKDNPLYDLQAVKKREDEQALTHSISAGCSSFTNRPKCPYCSSNNVTRITLVHKAGKIFFFGIFGMGDNGKTWRCNNCGSRF